MLNWQIFGAEKKSPLFETDVCVELWDTTLIVYLNPSGNLRPTLDVFHVISKNEKILVGKIFLFLT